jgi:hypothetical protein
MTALWLKCVRMGLRQGIVSIARVKIVIGHFRSGELSIALTMSRPTLYSVRPLDMYLMLHNFFACCLLTVFTRWAVSLGVARSHGSCAVCMADSESCHAGISATVAVDG